MIDTVQLQEICALPIESVAERLGLVVERHKTLCPFHDDRHPSLSFSVSRNRYKCFVCDAHGGVIDLAMKVLGTGFREACQWLGDAHSVIVREAKEPKSEHRAQSVFDPEKYHHYFERPYLNTQALDFLFGQRHLDPRVVRWCRLTSWTDKTGRPWLQIPYYDLDGHLIGIQDRYLGDDRSQPRFRFPSGSQCHLYNLPVLKRLHDGDDLYLAEGCSDCWSLLSTGHKAIAIPSATLLKAEELRGLLETPWETQNLASLQEIKFHIYPDQDEAGERLFLQLKEVIPNLIRHQLPVDCKDFSEYYVKWCFGSPSTPLRELLSSQV